MERSYCFGCSKNNPIGLKLQCFTQEDGSYATYFIPNRYHEGYPGIMHGGLAATILDELMSNQLLHSGYPAMTARLSLRFRRSLPVGERLKFVSRIVKRRNRLFQMEAWAELPDGQVAVEAQAEMMLRS